MYKRQDQQGAGSVLAFYKDMIAFRKTTPALKNGATIFHTLPEPILAFTRRGAEQITCVYNLSKTPCTVTLQGEARVTGHHNATLDGATLKLPANGFAFLAHAQDIVLSA